MVTPVPSISGYGAARSYAEEKFGGPVEEIETNPATGAASAEIAGNDPDAVWLLIINMGAFDAFIGFDSRVSALRGIRLAANGGFVSFNVDQDVTLPARAWQAISPGGASTLYVLRVRRIPGRG